MDETRSVEINGWLGWKAVGVILALVLLPSSSLTLAIYMLASRVSGIETREATHEAAADAKYYAIAVQSASVRANIESIQKDIARIESSIHNLDGKLEKAQ